MRKEEKMVRKEKEEKDSVLEGKGENVRTEKEGMGGDRRVQRV